jgi:hypothetical protein
MSDELSSGVQWDEVDTILSAHHDRDDRSAVHKPSLHMQLCDGTVLGVTSGTFGDVWRGLEKFSRIRCVVKVVKEKTDTAKKAKEEFDFLRLLGGRPKGPHPNIVQGLDLVPSAQTGTLVTTFWFSGVETHVALSPSGHHDLRRWDGDHPISGSVLGLSHHGHRVLHA